MTAPASTPSELGPWRWDLDLSTATGSADAVAAFVAKRFDSQGEAESWVGEFFNDLVAIGITSVTLCEADRVVYGPMSLLPA